MSMIAVGPTGSLLQLPDMYMRRMAVGPRAKGRIDLMRPIGENMPRSLTHSAATRTTSRRSCSTGRATTT